MARRATAAASQDLGTPDPTPSTPQSAPRDLWPGPDTAPRMGDTVIYRAHGEECPGIVVSVYADDVVDLTLFHSPASDIVPRNAFGRPSSFQGRVPRARSADADGWRAR